MSEETASGREHWSGGLGFVLAAAGSAVGLGNIWKFPYITGENGGGAFVLIYLICILIIGLPVMICEITLGRHTQKDPVGAFRMVCPKSSTVAHLFGFVMCLIGVSLLCFSSWGWGGVFLLIGAAIFFIGWTIVGVMGVLAGFVILSYYSVVAGWTIGYIGKSVFGGLSFPDAEAATESFKSFSTFSATGNWAPIICHLIFMGLCVAIVIGGVKKGIEKWSKILMPMLFLLIVALIIKGLSLPGAIKGVRFYLTPDFNKITANGVLLALGHAFFSLSLGMGAMITYGSYVSKKENLFLSSLAIVGLDTLIALLAGLAIFPAVFAQGFDPSEGPGLVFIILPRVFNAIPGGMFWAFLFFLLLMVAALTSGISLLEVVVAFCMDELKMSRRFSVILVGVIIAALGSFCAISVETWDNLAWSGIPKLLHSCFGSEGPSFFAVLEDLSSNYMLPLGGLFISLFVGWIWGTSKAVDEIRRGSHNFADVHLIALLSGLKDDPSHNSDHHVVTLASLWGIFIRFISPVAVLIAFLHTIKWITS